MLLDSKAKINAKDQDGNTPLRSMVDRGCTDVVRTLIDRKANVNMANNIVKTPLMAASWSGQSDITRALLFAKANYLHRDNTGLTAALYATQHGNDKIVKILREWPSFLGESLHEYILQQLEILCLQNCSQVASIVMDYFDCDYIETPTSFCSPSPLEQVKLDYLNANDTNDSEGSSEEDYGFDPRWNH